MLVNRLMKSPGRLSLLLLALLLSSCGRVVRVTSPLSDPEKAQPDEQLCGMWKLAETDDNASGKAFLFIGKVGVQEVPFGIMKAMAMEIDTNNKITNISLYFFSTFAADARYANLFQEDVVDPTRTPAWSKKSMRSFVLYKYRVKGDTLTIWDMDDDAVEAAVRKGQVKGKMEGSPDPKAKGTVYVTDGEDLLRFLRKGGDNKVFNDKHKTVFLRVK